jgi:hypothetical protein
MEAPKYSDGGYSDPAPAPAPTSGGTVIGTVTPIAATIVGGVLNTGDFTVRCAVINRGYQCESYPVPAGAVVELYPLYGNTKPVRVARYPEAAVLGPNTIVGPAAPARTFPVQNLNEIWVAAEVIGEGVAVAIRAK